MVGLGLGSGGSWQLHEHLHLTETLAVSERQQVEQTLLEESRRLADMERTEDEMAAAAIAASLADLSLSLGGSSAGAGTAAASRPLLATPLARRRPGSASPQTSNSIPSRSASPAGSTTSLDSLTSDRTGDTSS
jgi:hypothetical protein